MTPSERIQLIRAISKQLAVEELSVLDLTLRQYGIAIHTTYSHNRELRALHSLEGASDQTLVEMAEHVGISSLPSGNPQQADCWQPDAFRLFLSHVAADKLYVSQLQAALRPYRIAGFVAHLDIEPTREWEGEIEKALRSADALLAFLTPAFHSSKWTDQEVGHAVGRGLLVLPVRAGTDPYGFIGKYQALQGIGRLPSELAQDVFDALAKHALTREQLAEVVVRSFEGAWSWEGCRQDMGLLERFPFLGAGQIARLETAVSNNEKIKDTWTVGGRVETLVRKHRVEG